MEANEQIGKIHRVRSKIKKLPLWLKCSIAAVVIATAIGTAAVPALVNDSIPATATTLKKQDIEKNIMATGTLEPVHKQEFFTPVDSTLMELKVETGDRVQKGETLGRLDTMELSRKYEEARAKMSEKKAALAEAKAASDNLALEHATAALEKAENHYKRIKQLHQAGAVTIEELEGAQVELARVKTEYYKTSTLARENASNKRISSLQAQQELAAREAAQAEERLELATFTSQIDGAVLFVGAEKGNRVLEGSRLLVVGNDETLKATANINEIDAGKIKTGQPVKITCAALPGNEYQGQVSRVAAAAVNRKNGTSNSVHVPVTVELEGNTGNLKLGYTVDLTITTMKKENVLAVPFEAVVQSNGKKTVYVIEENTARARKVKTVPGNELFDIVTSGLKEGEKVILNPSPDVKDGREIKITGEG